jgi:DNA helicase-2/ATP-dependent DNA helicase PcrA
LTFTNKAADEMKSRVAQLVSDHQAWVGTFHKFCARLLRMHGPLLGLGENFTIYDASDARAALKEAFALADLPSRHFSPEMIGEEIARAKHHGVDSGSFAPRPGVAVDAVVAQVYRAYARVLRMANALDFDDLLLQSHVLLRDHPELRATLDERHRYILVDEYQDTNAVQFAIVRALSLDYPNVCATGDPDQSIYGWRGANVENILKFTQHFPQARTIRLEMNYRSTQAILRVADQLIQNNHRRLPKRLETNNELGVPVRLIAYPNVPHEASDIAETISAAIRSGTRSAKDFAILYRANWLSRSFEHELRLRGIPYLIVHGHEFYQRREIKDILAYLHLLNNPRDQVALQRIINVPPRKIGPATVDKLKADAAARGVSLLEAARRSGLNEAISKQAAAKVARFVALIDRLGEVRADGSVRKIIETVVAQTQFMEYLTEGESDEGHERAANVDELIAAAAEFDQTHPDDGGLENFLELASLVNDVDDWAAENDAVSLMTLHAAKGLEFPVVFVVGLEDGLLPHERNRQSEHELEEERRLLFVGMTRAKQELQLSRTLSRSRRGQPWQTIASRFLMELPRGEMHVIGPTSYEFHGPDVDLNPWDDDQVHEAAASLAVSRTTQPTMPAANRPAETDSKIMTAAQWAAKAEAARMRIPLDLFHVGLAVVHPTYGEGTIQSLSGQGLKRVAHIRFHDRERSFRLAYSLLQPVACDQQADS